MVTMRPIMIVSWRVCEGEREEAVDVERKMANQKQVKKCFRVRQLLLIEVKTFCPSFD